MSERMPHTPLDCEQWEALLADKLDGTLGAEAGAAFAEHLESCAMCTALLERARQGQQWLKLLEGSTPSAPVDLLSKILARTQGAGHEQDFALGTGVQTGLVPAEGGGRWSLPFLGANAGMAAARGAHQARLLMTAGMAFFSVALTLSLAGIRLTSVHAAELRPQVVEANVTRSFYGTKKQVVSFYDNLRLVYEVESKMDAMRHESTPANRTEAPTKATPKPEGKGVPGSETKAPGKLHGAVSPEPGRPTEEVLHGWPVSAGFRVAGPGGVKTAEMRRMAAWTVRGSAPRRPDGCVQDRYQGATSKERIRI
ncbi:MAG TPA: zf-HC2 domain-containing protein [Acidobacteriaceae bacterium]